MKTAKMGRRNFKEIAQGRIRNALELNTFNFLNTKKYATCLSGAWPYATFLLITIIINHVFHLLKPIEDMVIYSENYHYNQYVIIIRNFAQ